jgi:hypothetical protein
MRPLNITDALRLASLLQPYVDVKNLNPEQDAVDFIDSIVQKISAPDFLLSVKLLSNKTEQDLEKLDGYKILALFTQGLRENRVVTLLTFCDSFGK